MENILLFVIQRRPRFDEGVVVVVQSLDDVRERESISARASKSKELLARKING